MYTLICMCPYVHISIYIYTYRIEPYMPQNMSAMDRSGIWICLELGRPRDHLGACFVENTVTFG